MTRPAQQRAREDVVAVAGVSPASSTRDTGALARRLVPVVAMLGWLAAYRLNGPLWDWLVYDLAGLRPDGRLGARVHFFGYDTVKIGRSARSYPSTAEAGMTSTPIYTEHGGRRAHHRVRPAAMRSLAKPILACSTVSVSGEMPV